MQPLFAFNVIPKLPTALEPLREIVFNLWWTWEPDARSLFRNLDSELWSRTNHNPVRMLQLCRQARVVRSIVPREVGERRDQVTNRRIVLVCGFGRPDLHGQD